MIENSKILNEYPRYSDYPLFVDIANRTFGPKGTVRGLNIAATLWGSAAVGAATGADLLVEGILGTFFILSANTFLRPIVNLWIYKKQR